MRRFWILTMVFAMLLTLTACNREEAEETPGEDPQARQPEQESLDVLTGLPEAEDITLTAEVMRGRAPSGDYDLPEEVTSMLDWQRNGAVALLAEEGDVAFYALEGKESSPALLRWGDSMAEFDWWYATPQAIEPELWYRDIDGDREEEVVLSCYGSSGSGVSMEYLYVVEKSPGGSLTSYGLPWKELQKAVDEQLQTVRAAGRVYAALGRQTVDITDQIHEDDADAVDVRLGQVARFPGGNAGAFGVVAEGGGIERLSLYVADVQCGVRYENGAFTLEELSLVSR